MTEVKFLLIGSYFNCKWIKLSNQKTETEENRFLKT